MKRTPVLVDVHGTPLRESLGYTGGGIGFGGQMADWMPPAESVDAALLPSLRLGNARADDLVRNNGIAANAVALHKDHIVGHLFLISYRPNWRYLGMRESAAKSFVDEVEAAWTEYCDGIFGEMDAEGKRTFTEFIREGVGVHAFNGEIFLQPVWDAETTQVFRTRFKAVSPKRVDTPGYARGNRQLRAGVETDRNGKALAYHVCDDDWPVAGGDLQRFCRRVSLQVASGAEAVRALAVQLPGLRQKLNDGWYQVRIAGDDVTADTLTTSLHDPLPPGAVIHIVPRLAGAKSGGVFQAVLGAALIAVAWWNPAGWLGAAAVSGMYMTGASMVLGGVAQMLAPKPKMSEMRQTDNGRQNTYFSSLDNMVANGNTLPVLYGEMQVGSRVISQEVSTADEGDGGQVVVIGR
ncbi:phage portal protein [Salmonella enterica]|nr:phage portal protein [Salmonella enterica]EEC0787823.1 phage portal protein [Salmonella enterica subsp. enterica]EAS1995472.1 phage portal protein [Salmonella enterica]EAX6331710.1 phage portal protein [Salmonella enterica]EBO9975054.1 phage portal protein [Salmonella enterica]